jgi:NAD(P)H-flavin reductase
VNQNKYFINSFFENLEIDFVHFSFIPTLSGESQNWKGERGRVTKLLPDLAKKYIDAQFFLCGSAEMVRDVRALLLTSGVPMQNIKIEIFT